MSNKIVSIVVVLFFLCGITILNLTNAEGKTTKKTEPKTFIGKIDSISLADPVKGTKSEIIGIDKDNKKFSFLITSTTTMYSARSVPITLDKIKKGDNVKVKYITTKEGINEAISVWIVP